MVEVQDHVFNGIEINLFYKEEERCDLVIEVTSSNKDNSSFRYNTQRCKTLRRRYIQEKYLTTYLQRRIAI